MSLFLPGLLPPWPRALEASTDAQAEVAWVIIELTKLRTSFPYQHQVNPYLLPCSHPPQT